MKAEAAATLYQLPGIGSNMAQFSQNGVFSAGNGCSGDFLLALLMAMGQQDVGQLSPQDAPSPDGGTIWGILSDGTGKTAPKGQETGPGIQADASALWQYLPDLQGILTAGLLPVQFQAPVTAKTEDPGQVPEIAGPGSLTVLEELVVKQTDSQQPGVRNGEGPGVILPGVFSDESGAAREADIPQTAQASQAAGTVRVNEAVIPEADGASGRAGDGQLTDFSSRAGNNGINPPNSQSSIDITVDSETVAVRNKSFPVTAAGNPEPKPGEAGPDGMLQYSWVQSDPEQAESAPDRVLRANQFSENTPAGQPKPAAGTEQHKPQAAQLYVDQKPAADSARALGADQETARVTAAVNQVSTPETKPVQVAQGPGSDGTREAGKKDVPGDIRGDSAVTVISNSKAEDTGDRQPESQSQSQFQSNQSTAGNSSEITGLDPGEGAQESAITVSTPVFNVTARKFPAVILPHVMASLKNMTAENSRVTVIRLKLEPKNMGEIKIRLSYSNGELSAHFFTSSGLVRDAVECSLPQLKEALAQHNVSLGEAAAFVGQDQQSHKGTPGGFSQGSREGFARGFTGEKAAGSAITSQAWGGSSSLDLLI